MSYRGRAPWFGYTIVEVMVVLSVTGILFVSAVGLFQGQSGKTQLSQSLYDIASRIQTYASEVNSGVYPDSENYSCSANNGAGPILSQSTQSAGSRDQCIFLGRALHLTYDSTSKSTSNQLVAYSVLGLRDIWSGSTDTGTPVTSFDQAVPTPAQSKTSRIIAGRLVTFTSWVLYSSYTLPNGEYFTKSTVKDQNGTTKNQAGTDLSNNFLGLFGMYLDVSGGNSTTALNLRAYNFQDDNVAQGAEASCIEQVSPCDKYVGNIRSWEVCVGNGNLIGSVMVNATSTGVTTTVNAGACPS